MKWITTLLIIISGILCSCNFISDSDKSVDTELSRNYNSKHTKYILKVRTSDGGASDGGRTTFHTIVRSTDSKPEKPVKWFASEEFDDIYWQGNDTVILAENFTDFISDDISKFKDSIITVSGTIVKIIQKDPIDTSYKRRIIKRETSPDKTAVLLVYRYEKPAIGHYFTNISIIKPNDSVPKFGNFYITRYDYECITDIKWDNTNALVITVGESCYYAFQDYLNKKRPDIKYKLRMDEN